MKVLFKHRLEYALVRMVMLGLRFLPESLAYGGFAMLGQTYFLLSRRRRDYARRFLRQAFPDRPDKELMQIGRRSTGNFFKVVLDMLRVNRVLSRGELLQHLEGREEFVQSLPNAPVLMVTGHLGSWEIGGVSVAALCGESHAVARTFKNPLLQRLLAHSRRATGLHLHSRRGGIRSLARALKNGAVAMQAVDQNQRLRGVFVPYFGKLASTERAAATLAVREGYPVAVCFCLRIGSGFRFRLDPIKLIRPEVPSDRAAVPGAVKRLVLEINRHLEEAVLRYPEQYLWIHDRYRTQPNQQLEESLDELDALVPKTE
ncbi:MAG: lysophospholipid acyltransferase family protein [Planctomycetes bacterium]|nr:lysophospholipid acyltransferase family protein [Planctomycetota bacterium]